MCTPQSDFRAWVVMIISYIATSKSNHMISVYSLVYSSNYVVKQKNMGDKHRCHWVFRVLPTDSDGVDNAMTAIFTPPFGVPTTWTGTAMPC